MGVGANFLSCPWSLQYFIMLANALCLVIPLPPRKTASRLRLFEERWPCRRFLWSPSFFMFLYLYILFFIKTCIHNISQALTVHLIAVAKNTESERIEKPAACWLAYNKYPNVIENMYYDGCAMIAVLDRLDKNLHPPCFR